MGETKTVRYIHAEDVVQMLGCKRSKAYNVIRTLNKELEEQGKITFAGRVPESYFKLRTNVVIKDGKVM